MNDPREAEPRVRGTRERDEFWGRTYHIRLKRGGSKEMARAHACYETLKAFGSTPFAKQGDPQP